MEKLNLWKKARSQGRYLYAMVSGIPYALASGPDFSTHTACAQLVTLKYKLRSTLSNI